MVFSFYKKGTGQLKIYLSREPEGKSKASFRPFVIERSKMINYNTPGLAAKEPENPRPIKFQK